MTGMGLDPQHPGRGVAFAVASAIHVAIGMALFSHAQAGMPARGESGIGGDRPMVIELLPLEDARVSHRAGGSAVAVDAPPVRRFAAVTGNAHQWAGVQDSGDGSSEPAALATTRTTQRAATELPAAEMTAAEMTAYRVRLQEHLARFRAYPAAARRAGQQGVVQVHFSMDGNGRVIDAWIESGSGFDDIDREALGSIMRAQPLPALPGAWPERLDISLPITFQIG